MLNLTRRYRNVLLVGSKFALPFTFTFNAKQILSQLLFIVSFNLIQFNFDEISYLYLYAQHKFKLIKTQTNRKKKQFAKFNST